MPSDINDDTPCTLGDLARLQNRIEEMQAQRRSDEREIAELTARVAALETVPDPGDFEQSFDAVWLVEMGGRLDEEKGTVFFWGGFEGNIEIEVEVFENGDNIVWVEEKRMFVDAKRGDMRRLFKALP